MKAAIISMGSVSSKITAKALRKYFEEVDEVDIRKIEVNVTGNDEILYDGKTFPDYDCVFIKGSFRFASLQTALSTILETKGTIYLPLRSVAFMNAHDKLLTHLQLQKEKIPMPGTFISSTPEASKNILKKMDYPIILKIPQGTQGKGVMFAESFAAASSMLDTLSALKQPFIIQEFVETDGSDIRAIVVGDKVVAAFKRKAQKEEKRANIHAGGTGEPIVLDDMTKRLAIRTGKAIGADICGVDILEGPKGPLVIEVNLSPGLQGIMKATNIDVPEKLAKFLFEKTVEYKGSSSGKKTDTVLSDLGIEKAGSVTNGSKIETLITHVDLRGERILLPKEITKLSKIDDKTELEITVSKGKVEMKTFGK